MKDKRTDATRHLVLPIRAGNSRDVLDVLVQKIAGSVLRPVKGLLWMKPLREEKRNIVRLEGYIQTNL